MLIKQKRTNSIKSKIKYDLSFLLIYPIFQCTEKKRFLKEKLKALTFYKKRLISLVCQKQELLKTIFNKTQPDEVDKLSNIIVTCSYTKITEENFCDINAQMERIARLVPLKKSTEAPLKKFLKESWPCTSEIKLISQYYYSILGLLKQKYETFPWKYLLQINNLESYQITI